MNLRSIEAAWNSRKVGGSTLLVALAMASAADGDTGEVRLTVSQLMALTRIKARCTVQNALRALEAAGFIQLQGDNRGGARRATVYLVTNQAVPHGTAMEAEA
jgi:hypothetical protein